MKKKLFFLFVCFNILIYSQTAPENTRLIQQNTLKGSRLSLVEITDNYTYHVGTTNSSEVGLDNLSATNVGLDDLFILKSSSSTGSNSWFKTFNSGSKGIISPKYVYVDSAENLYVFAQFKGTIAVGNKTISSVNSADAFLLKIDNNGNAVWINYLANGYNSLYKAKCITDGIDTFFVYGQNHLARINDVDGNIVYDNIYNGAELKSVGIKEQSIFVGGATLQPFVVFGTEVIAENNVGFVVKGDKNANFTSSLKTAPTDTSLIFSDINDIAFSSDGSLLISGFYTNKAINLVTENGSVSFTYNPNTTYVNNRLYNFVAKVDANLDTISFFRTSSPLASDGTYNIRTHLYSTKLVPYGNNGNFRQLIYIGSGSSRSLFSFTNTNGSLTNLDSGNVFNEYTLNTSNDQNGNYLQNAEPVNYNFKMSTSANYYTQVNNNLRVFTSNILNTQDSNLVWNKQKTYSVGGSISGTFINHLNSEKGDLFLTALFEGKANFFGTQINNNIGSYSRFIARLGVDGLPKWKAKFDYSKVIDNNYNVSQNYATVDKNDNLYILINRSDALSSNFTDANGTVITFSQYLNSDNRVLVKLDKNGKYIWGKEISGTKKAGIVVDSNDNIFVTGIAGYLYVNGANYNSSGTSSLFILKFDVSGNLAYSKVYQNEMDAYSISPVLDTQNNLYIFSEPINRNGFDYSFGNISIPTNQYNTDLIMLKFDSLGNVIFGKNFYANSTIIDYGWPNDVKFDGNDFIMMGNYYSNSSSSTNYVGLDLVNIPKVYTPNTYVPFFAKININGNVIWQKAVDSNNSNTGNYTNINLDENKNIYMYYYVKDKISINGTEYTFDATKGNKILLKLDTNGALKYFKKVDLSASSYPLVDVFGEDKVNVAAFTSEDNILNYPVNNSYASNFYIATFGSLEIKYLTPQYNSQLLTNTTITNNPNNANTFSFELINNVNWSATSDQSWLNLSFIDLNGKNNFKNSISGNGDAKVTMTAETNNTGVTRTGNVMISGDQGVASKTVIVTQTAILETNESKTFVMTLYPNPTSEILNIQSDVKISKIEIFDLTGKFLKSENGKDKKITVSQLIKGMYLIKLYTENGVVNSKFIKK